MTQAYQLGDLGQYLTVDTTGNNISLSTNSLSVGNSVTNVVINSTSFTGSANNTSYVGTVSAANVVSNAQLVANLANYTNTAGMSAYQTTAGLSANVATLTANNTSFVGTVSAANVVSNAQLSGNLSLYGTLAGEANRVAAFTANNTTYLNGQLASYYTNASNITTGTLPYAQLGSAVVNTSGNFTIAGNLNFTATNNYFGTALYVGANVVINTSSHYVGNSTVNTSLSSSSLYVQSLSSQPTINLNSSSSSVGNRPLVVFQTTNTTLTQFFGGMQWTSTLVGGFVTQGSQIFSSGSSSNSTGYMDIIAQTTTSGNFVVQSAGSGANNLVSNSTGTYLLSNTLTIGTGSYFVANGNVGVACTAPAYKLDVVGDIRASANIYGTLATTSQPNITANNANYLGTVAAASYQLNSTLSANVATLSANNASYLGTVAAASYVNTSGAYTISGVHTHTANVVLNNNKDLNFQTVNTSNYVSFIQQNDDNFVFYSTNTAGGTRAVFSIYANSITSNLNIGVRTHVAGGINIPTGVTILDSTGSQGTAGQVLTSNGTGNVYWSTVSAGGSYTFSTGLVNTSSTITVNASYIATIASNSATYANASVSNTFTIGTSAYYLANGSFSIGTSDPTYSGNVGSVFTINSRGSTALAIGYSNTQLSFAINPLSAGAWTMYDRAANGGIGVWTAGITQSNGNVGIGTTSPGVPLQVNGNAVASNFAFGTTTGAAGTIGSDTGFVGPRITFYGNTYGSTPGQLSLTTGSASIVFGTSNAEKMRIDSSGNVGIGTSTPAQKLEVYSSTTNLGRIRVTGATTTSGNFRGFELANSSGFTGGMFQDESSNDLTFWTSAERMRIDSNGNMYIGSTGSLSSERYLVKGVALGGTAGNVSYNSVFYTPDTTNTTRLSILDYRVTTGSDHTTSRNKIQRRVDSTDMGYVGFDSTGTSIGWGTTESLRVTSSGVANVTGGTFYANNLLLQGDGTNAYIRPNNSGSALYLGANNTNYVSLVANGNFGIGTTSPDHPLTVAGGSAIAYFNSSGTQSYIRLSVNSDIAQRIELANRGGRTALWNPTGGDVFNILHSAGYVGINTSSPIRRLHIQDGSTNAEMSLTGSSSTGSAFFNVSDSAGSNGSGWNLYIRGLGSSGTASANLASVTIVSSSTVMTGSSQSTIMYDYNDTGYYIDPNSTSKLNTIVTNSYLYFGSQTGSVNNTSSPMLYADITNMVIKPGSGNGSLFFQDYYGTTRSTYNFQYGDWYIHYIYDKDDTGYHLDINGTSYLGVVSADRFYTGYDSGIGNSVSCSNWFRSNGSSGWYNDTYGGGINMQDSTWVRVYNNKQFYSQNLIQSDSSVRAPIFYDTNDTNYYADPNSWSRMANINANIYQSQDNWWLDSAGNQRMLWVSADHNYYKTNNYHVFRRMDNTDLAYIASDGNIWMGTYHDWLSTQIRSGIFYDQNDTSYYCDPNSQSNFYQLNVYGNQIILQGGSPTIFFNDIDEQCAVLHNNSSLLYILRKDSYSAGWSPVGSGNWPMVCYLYSNDFVFGGAITSIYGMYANASDRRLKDNIVEIPNAIDKIKQIRGVTFSWNAKADEVGFKPDIRDDVGVIAQEIQAVLPEAVHMAPFDTWSPSPDEKMTADEVKEKRKESKSGENYLTVQMEKIVPLLIEGIKEQQLQIEGLQKQINDLINMMNNQ